MRASVCPKCYRKLGGAYGPHCNLAATAQTDPVGPARRRPMSGTSQGPDAPRTDGERRVFAVIKFWLFVGFLFPLGIIAVAAPLNDGHGPVKAPEIAEIARLCTVLFFTHVALATVAFVGLIVTAVAYPYSQRWLTVSAFLTTVIQLAVSLVLWLVVIAVVLLFSMVAGLGKMS